MPDETDTSFIPKTKETYKCRNYIKKRIIKEETVFRDYNDERLHVLEMMKRTIKMGESNSALLIGPRSSGKSTLVNSVIAKLKYSRSFQERAVLVELNGLIHTDDRLALKDMTRQMGLENVMNGKVFGSFAENLTFLLDCLKSGDRASSKSTLIILDEFDLFCGHNKQTLLYNLFDVAQSAQAPLCVLGLTCRLDVTELLEKRVKSRFSHRQIFLFPRGQGNSSALNSRMELLKHFLSLPVDEEEDDELDISPKLIQNWNKKIEVLVQHSEVKDVMKSLYQYDVSERTFKNLLIVLVSRLAAKHPFLCPSDFVQVHAQYMEDAKVNMLKGLSVLEMCLIIAMRHHTEIYDGNPLNFEMVFRSYLKFVSRNSSVHITERSVVLKAFEHIKNLELILPVKGSSKHLQKEHQMHHFMLTSDQVAAAVKVYQNLPTEVMQWALSSLQ